MSRIARWTLADDLLLRRLHAEGKTIAEIAAALVRTLAACETRKLILGLKKVVPLVPCVNCDQPRRTTNKFPLCGRCMGLASVRRRYGQPRRQVCKECGREFRHGSRGLCGICNKNPEILSRYPRKRETQLKPEHLQPTMPVLREYPDHAAPVRCPHGEWEETCARCEMAQRARLGIAVSVEAEEEAA